MSDHLEQIRNNISIVDLISQNIKLTKKGREYLGLCPFHNEKTPSFYVNPQKGFYYCFGCSAKGNIFNFYMDYYKVSFQDALEHLAKVAGVSLPKNINFQSFKKNEKLYQVCDIARNYFKDTLNKENARIVQKYLEERRLTREIIEKFELGYAFGSNQELWNYLQESKIYDEDILEVGLKNNNDRGEIYEFFRDRLIFPIKDTRGQVIAFGGRTLTNKNPKYLNSKESKIFYKKNHLYGLYESLRYLDNNNLIITEGYMDVIALHQRGFKTAIATLGTAITENHLSLISKYDNSPIFCLDGDLAGRKSTMRVIDLYLENMKVGFNPRFIFLPEKEDPDSYIQKNSRESFKLLLENSQAISEVLLQEEIYSKNLSIPEVAASCFKNLQDKANRIKDYQLRKNFIDYFKSNTIYNRRGNNNFFNKKKSDLLNSKSYIVDSQSEGAGVLLFCVLGYPTIFPEVEEKLAYCNFKNEKLERLKLFLLENEFIIDNNGDYSFNEDSLEEVQDYLNYIMDLKLVRPVVNRITSKEEALEEFNNAYAAIAERGYLEEKIKEIQGKIQKIIQGDLSDDDKRFRLKRLNLERQDIMKQKENILKT